MVFCIWNNSRFVLQSTIREERSRPQICRQQFQRIYSFRKIFWHVPTSLWMCCMVGWLQNTCTGAACLVNYLEMMTFSDAHGTALWLHEPYLWHLMKSFNRIVQNGSCSPSPCSCAILKVQIWWRRLVGDLWLTCILCWARCLWDHLSCLGTVRKLFPILRGRNALLGMLKVAYPWFKTYWKKGMLLVFWCFLPFFDHR